MKTKTMYVGKQKYKYTDYGWEHVSRGYPGPDLRQTKAGKWFASPRVSRRTWKTPEEALQHWVDWNRREKEERHKGELNRLRKFEP